MRQENASSKVAGLSLPCARASQYLPLANDILSKSNFCICCKLDNLEFFNYNHHLEGIRLFIDLHVIAMDKLSECNSLAES